MLVCQRVERLDLPDIICRVTCCGHKGSGYTVSQSYRSACHDIDGWRAVCPAILLEDIGIWSAFDGNLNRVLCRHGSSITSACH